MGASLRKIASITNYSRSTVAKVLRGHTAKYRISSEAEQKILSAAKQWHYRPNKQAESLQRGTSNTIAFLAPSLSGLFFSQIIEGIERAAKNHKKHLILSVSAHHNHS